MCAVTSVAWVVLQWGCHWCRVSVPLAGSVLVGSRGLCHCCASTKCSRVYFGILPLGLDVKKHLVTSRFTLLTWHLCTFANLITCAWIKLISPAIAKPAEACWDEWKIQLFGFISFPGFIFPIKIYMLLMTFVIFSWCLRERRYRGFLGFFVWRSFLRFWIIRGWNFLNMRSNIIGRMSAFNLKVLSSRSQNFQVPYFAYLE